MKQQYKTLIIDTILKEVRNKTLLVMFIVTTLLIYFGHQTVKFFTSAEGMEGLNVAVTGGTLTTSLWLLNIFAFVVATFFGVSVLKTDIETKLVYQYLTFPISRIEYFVCRVLGAWLLVMAYYLYAYLLTLVLYSATFGEMFFSLKYLATFGVLAVYLLIVLFIAIFFSLLFNKMGALFVVFLIGVVSSASFNALKTMEMSEIFSNFGLFKIIGIVTYFLFPRFSFLSDISSHLLFEQTLTYGVIGQVIHLVIMCAIYAALGMIVLRKKDF